MKEHIQNLIEMEEVRDIIYFSFEGTILFKYFKQERAEGSGGWDPARFSAALAEIREAELVFENNLFYITRGRLGFLLIVLERSAPVALIRLHCDILLPALEQEFQHKPRRFALFSRFSRKRKS